MFESDVKKKTMDYDVGRMYISGEIDRSSPVTVQLLHIEDGKEKEMLTLQGNIDSFIKKPYGLGGHLRPLNSLENGRNRLEMAVFWKDTYNYLNCSGPGVDQSKPFWVNVEVAQLDRTCEKLKLYQDEEFSKLSE